MVQNQAFIPRGDGAVPGVTAEFVSDAIRSTTQYFEQDFPGTQVMCRKSLLAGAGYIACVFCEGKPDGPEFYHASALKAGLSAMEEYQKRAVREMEQREARDAENREPDLSAFTTWELAKFCHDDSMRFINASDAEKVKIFTRWQPVLLRKIEQSASILLPTAALMEDPLFVRKHWDELPGWLAEQADEASSQSTVNPDDNVGKGFVP